MYLNIISTYLLSSLVSTLIGMGINLYYLKYLANEGYKIKLKDYKENKYPEPVVKISKFYTLIPIFNISYILSKIIDVTINKNGIYKKLYKDDKIIRMDQEEMESFEDDESYTNVVSISYNQKNTDTVVSKPVNTAYVLYETEKGKNYILFEVVADNINIIQSAGPVSKLSNDDQLLELVFIINTRDNVVHVVELPKRLIKKKKRKNKKD